MHREWGKYYETHNKPEKSIQHFQLALDRFNQAKDTSGLIKTYVNMGFFLVNMAELDEAIKSTEQALELNRKTEDLDVRALIINNLGVMYEQKPDGAEKAMIYHKEALSLAQKLGDIKGMLASNNNLGTLHWRTKKEIEALQYYDEALQIAFTLKDSLEICRIMSNKVYIHLNLKQEASALKLLSESEVYCQNIDLKLQSHRKNLLSLTYKQKGRYREALEALEEHVRFSDSLKILERDNIVKELVVKYETEQKELQIHQLEVEQVLQQKTIQQQRRFQMALWTGLLLMAAFSLLLFFQRNRISRERERSEALLLNILPAEVAAELKQSGQSQARKFEHTTILFTDFVNFTTIAAGMTPEDLVTELDTCFRAFDEIMGRYGLEKIKTIGDAYLAIGGLPQPQEDHALNVCRAAIEIVQFIDQRKKAGGVFEIRIGIHSGAVIAGIVGVKKYAYDIWGDTVNMAARMEQNSEPGKINISESTYDIIHPTFKCIPRGKMTAKNKGEVDMYFLEVEAN